MMKPVSVMPSGRKDAALEIGFQVLPAGDLDHASGDVDVDAVFPTFARIESQRRAQRGQLAGRAPPAGRFSRRNGSCSAFHVS